MTTKAKKLLLIFDLPKTLLLAEQITSKTKHFDQRAVLESLRPDDTIERYKIFWRTGRPEFLDYFFVKNYTHFDIGVWSSLERELTGSFAKSFFGRHYRNLLFVSASSRQQYEGVLTQPSLNPIQIERDLSLIVQKFPEYDLNNIILISNLQNLHQPSQFNDLIIPQYCPTVLGESFTQDLTLSSMTKYIQGISLLYEKGRIDDVRPTLRGKKFEFLMKRLEFHDKQFQEYI